MIGISLLKYTKAKSITFSDYHETILENLMKNIKANQKNHTHKQEGFESACKLSSNTDILDFCPLCFDRFNIESLDWRDYETYENKFDMVIGSELIYQGGFIEELVKLINRMITDSGKAFIVMPEKRSMRDKFEGYLKENNMSFKVHHFNDIKENNDNFYIPILESESESKKAFENIENMNILYYEIINN